MQVREKGGLLVIGTSFQDSRRSENQLRGRAGRQGDPGESLMMYDMVDPVLANSDQLLKCKPNVLCGGFAARHYPVQDAPARITSPCRLYSLSICEALVVLLSSTE